MKIKIPYDGALAEVDFPRGADLLQPKEHQGLDDSELSSKLVHALAEYCVSTSDSPITVIVNDATRRLPTSKILDIILGCVKNPIEVLVATGTHRQPTDTEMDIIFGQTRKNLEGRIFVHDCRDNDSLINIGSTSRWTPVAVNRKLINAKHIICINSVEPHFFAGYTGGRKSFIPGLAGFETIIQNHSHAKYEESKSLNLETNPVHLDLEEAVNLVDPRSVFSIQLVTSRTGEAIDLFCGDLKKSFEQAVSCARKCYAIDITNKYDIVFAVGEAPLDINLYQLQKAQEHGAEAVKDGGILITAGACNEGVGSEYFMKLADDYPTPESALSCKAMKDNRFGIHKLIKTARRLQKIKVWYVTKLDDNLIKKVYYEPKKSLQAALDEALIQMGKDASIAILKDACFNVPVI